MDSQRAPRSLNDNYGSQNTDRANLSYGEGWPNRVLDEMKDMLVALSSVGRVLYASPSCQWITGYTVKQLEGNPISQFIHEEDRPVVTQQMDESVATGRPPRYFHFRFNKMGNIPCVLEAYGHPHIARHSVDLGNGNSGRRCDGFFLLKEEDEEELNASRLSSLRQDNQNTQGLHSQHHSYISSLHSSYTQTNVHDSATTSTDDNDLDAVYNVDGSDSRLFLDHLADKLPPNDDLAHIDGIEVMTGLYYGEGERSQGLSTGVHRGRLVQRDIDITTTDQQARTIQDGDRRKRLKGEYLCTDCGNF